LTEQERIEQAAKEAFKALRAKAQRELGGNTQPLIVVYAVECFLRRLSMSEYAVSPIERTTSGKSSLRSAL
jgi:hypothetical protein